MGFGHYKLNRLGEPELCHDFLEWARWFESNPDRHVALDEISGVRIRTVFLGLDHSFGDCPPILWETMIFCDDDSWAGRFNEYQRRYASRNEAIAGHAEAVAQITYALN